MTQRQVFPPFGLRARALRCGRGGMPIGPALDFQRAAGTGLVLTGPNGVGKSTLLLTLAGLLPPLGGTLELSGTDPEAGPSVHYCAHRNAVRARLRVAETLSFWRALNGATGLDVAAALNRVGLAQLARLDAGYLSAGQQRRLALARLLVSARPVWLLDEPTAALDAAGHRLVATLLVEHLAAGGIAIVATHDALAVPGLDTLALEPAP